jgi:NADP-dependent 3-hydroxy acid dehydrogenase YdfG
MAAVVAGAAEVEAVLRARGLSDQVVAANRNAPRQTVISGATAEVTEAMKHLADEGFSVRQIPVACAFHSPVVSGAGALFADVLATRDVRRPALPVFANRTAAPYPDDPAAIRAELVAQLVSPVRFADQVEAMYAAGARVFVEAGPGCVLTKLVAAILGDRPHRAIALEGRRSGVAGFLDALAELAVSGVQVDPGRLMRGREAVDAGRVQPARRAGWSVDGHLVRTAAGELLPGALVPARIVKEISVTTQADHYAFNAATDALIADFMRTGREMIAAQRDVLLTHLGSDGSSVPAWASAPVAMLERTPADRPAEALLPRAPAEPAAGTVSAVPAPSPAAGVGLTPDAVLRTVIETIAERTGYPMEMIEPDLDLESDLSIDSIKRTEIVGLLARRLAGGGDEAGLDVLSDAELEELSRARTAVAITAWLGARLAPSVAAGPASAAPVASAPAIEPAEYLAQDPAGEAPLAAGPVAAGEPAVIGHAPVRLVFERKPLPALEEGAQAIAGRRFLLLGGDDSVAAITAALAAHGAQAMARDATHVISSADAPVDGVLFLDPLCGDGPAVLPACVPVLQAALRDRPRWLVAARRAGNATGGDPGRADGLRGLMRSLSREYPDSIVRLVELDLPGGDRTHGGRMSPESVAQALLTELLAGDREPVVLRDPDGRHGLTLVESDLGVLASTGGGPAGDGASEAEALGLDSDAVVLLVGGARGITARFAAALAGVSRCRLELLGRTPLPEGLEDPATAAAQDRKALRAVLARRGVPIAEVDAAASALLAAREVTATLAELRALGSQAHYRSVDGEDPDALARAAKEIYAAHGRLDGVVFAAGVIEDKVFAEKDPRSFARVFATKADGARALLDALGDLPDGPRFTVLFGSIAAVFGNRGQSDYAAANDALDSVGARWAQRTGYRALTVHWGPWAPQGVHSGMVSEALARDYSRREIRMIDPEAGTLALLRELAWGPDEFRSVVYTASGW